jgi:predicted  nucleic acid-binding Zn-ribbon protein
MSSPIINAMRRRAMSDEEKQCGKATILGPCEWPKHHDWPCGLLPRDEPAAAPPEVLQPAQLPVGSRVRARPGTPGITGYVGTIIEAIGDQRCVDYSVECLTRPARVWYLTRELEFVAAVPQPDDRTTEEMDAFVRGARDARGPSRAAVPQPDGLRMCDHGFAVLSFNCKQCYPSNEPTVDELLKDFGRQCSNWSLRKNDDARKLFASHQAIEERFARLTSELRTAQEQREQLLVTADHLGIHYNELRKAFDAKDRESAGLREELRLAREDVAYEKNRATASENVAHEYESQVDKLQAQLGGLRGELRLAREAIDEIETCAEDAEKVVAALTEYRRQQEKK